MNASMRELATDEISRPYVVPPRHPPQMTLKQRMAMDRLEVSQVPGTSELGSHPESHKGKIRPKQNQLSAHCYEPVHHKGTGVNDLEAGYKSALLSINDACELLKGGPDEVVVRLSWDAILRRGDIENEVAGRMLEEHNGARKQEKDTADEENNEDEWKDVWKEDDEVDR